MNDFLSLAQKRYAVRSYLPKPVEAEKLERILEAGRVAPTAKNTQPFRFLVVQHPERLKKLSACTNVKGYPLAIIVCSVASEVWVRPFDGKSKPDTDAAIAATHMLLEATDLGLGSCWLMHFDPTPIREQFRIPEGQIILLISFCSFNSYWRIKFPPVMFGFSFCYAYIIAGYRRNSYWELIPALPVIL